MTTSGCSIAGEEYLGMVKVRNRSLFILLLVAACLAPPVMATPRAGWLAQLDPDNPDAAPAESADTLPPTPTDTPPELSPTFRQPDQLPEDATLTIARSASMGVITQALVEQFQQVYPNTTVTITERPAEAALADLQAGTTDLVAIGRPLSDEQEAQGFKAIPVSREKIAVIVSSDNPFVVGDDPLANQIEAEDFVQIFRGEIANWYDLGGPDLPIRFVDRPETSDTRAALADYEIFGGDLTTGDNVMQVADDSTAEVVAALGDNGISYAIASQVVDQDNVRVLGMHNTLPDDPRYPYSQPRSYVYRSTEELPPAVEAFLALATNAQGQEIVAEAKAAEAADVAAADLPDRINAVRPDGQGFVTGDRTGNLYFWNLDGTPAAEPIAAHTGPVTALAFSADGQRLISGGADGTIRFWDAVGTPIGNPINAASSPVTSLAVRPDGGFISASADGTLQSWDSTGASLGAPIAAQPNTIRDLALTSDGTTLITAAEDGTIQRWNVTDGTPIGDPLIGHQGAVRALATKPDGSFFSGGADGTLRYWGADGQQIGDPIQVAGPVNAIAANADGSTLVVGDETGSLQYLSGEGVPIGPALTDVGAPIDDLAFTPDGQRLIVSAGDTPQLRDSAGQIIPIPEAEVEEVIPPADGISPELVAFWQRVRSLPPQILWIIPVAILGLLVLGLLRSFRQDEEALEGEVIGVLPEAAPTPSAEFDDDRAMGFTPEDTATLDPSLARAKQTLAEGVDLGNRGRYQEALDRFNKAIELADLERLKAAAAGTTLAGATTVIARGLGRRGTTLANLGRTNDAISSLNRSLEMDPSDLAAWIGKGNVLLIMGQWDEALFCFDKAIELNANVAAAWQGKGRALQKLGRDTEARNAFAKADALGGVKEEIPIDLGTPVGVGSSAWESFDSALDVDETLPSAGEGRRSPASPPIEPGPIPTPAPSDRATTYRVPSPPPSSQSLPQEPPGRIGIAPPEPIMEITGELPPDLLAAIESLPPQEPTSSPPPPPLTSPGVLGGTTSPDESPAPAPPETTAEPDIPEDVQQALEYLPTEPESPDPNAPVEPPIEVPPEVEAILAGDSSISSAAAIPESNRSDPMADFLGEDASVSMRSPAAQAAPPAAAERSPAAPTPPVVHQRVTPDRPDEGDDPSLDGLPPEVIEALRGIPADSPDSFDLPPERSKAVPPPPPSNPRIE